MECLHRSWQTPCQRSSATHSSRRSTTRGYSRQSCCVCKQHRCRHTRSCSSQCRRKSMLQLWAPARSLGLSANSCKLQPGAWPTTSAQTVFTLPTMKLNQSDCQHRAVRARPSTGQRASQLASSFFLTARVRGAQRSRFIRDTGRSMNIPAPICSTS